MFEFIKLCFVKFVGDGKVMKELRGNPGKTGRNGSQPFPMPYNVFQKQWIFEVREIREKKNNSFLNLFSITNYVDQLADSSNELANARYAEYVRVLKMAFRQLCGRW